MKFSIFELIDDLAAYFARILEGHYCRQVRKFMKSVEPGQYKYLCLHREQDYKYNHVYMVYFEFYRISNSTIEWLSPADTWLSCTVDTMAYYLSCSKRTGLYSSPVDILSESVPIHVQRYILEKLI